MTLQLLAPADFGIIPNFFAYSLALALGAAVGSFLNVVIHRIPQQESIVFPNSACPGCQSPIKPYDNVPIFSWIVLRGKCRSCGISISPRYLAVELLTAVIFVVVLATYGLSIFLPIALIFVSAMIALIFIDAENMILPNVITYPLLAFAVLMRLILPIAFGMSFSDLGAWPLKTMSGVPLWLVSLGGAALGAAAGGGSLWLVGELWKHLRGIEAMGLGDVKMMLGVGALLGWRLALLSIFAAALVGSIAGIFVIMGKKDRNFQAQIPFGIFLGLGSIIAMLWGENIIGWYASRFI